MTDEEELKKLAMQVRSRVSEVAQAFGAGAGTNVDNAERFIHTCIPESWKPRVISGGMWNDLQRQTYGVIHHGIWLDDFPLSIESPTDQENIRDIWSGVESALRHNLDTIKGVEITHDLTSTTDRPPHVWQWSFVYKALHFSGEFTFFIAPHGQQKALLIGTLMEFKKDAHAA